MSNTALRIHGVRFGQSPTSRPPSSSKSPQFMFLAQKDHSGSAAPRELGGRMPRKRTDAWGGGAPKNTRPNRKHVGRNNTRPDAPEKDGRMGRRGAEKKPAQTESTETETENRCGHILAVHVFVCVWWASVGIVLVWWDACAERGWWWRAPAGDRHSTKVDDQSIHNASCRKACTSVCVCGVCVCVCGWVWVWCGCGVGACVCFRFPTLRVAPLPARRHLSWVGPLVVGCPVYRSRVW
jgi:hypothetical protein